MVAKPGFWNIGVIIVVLNRAETEQEVREEWICLQWETRVRGDKVWPVFVGRDPVVEDVRMMKDVSLIDGRLEILREGEEGAESFKQYLEPVML